MFSGFLTSASGMTAERARMQTIAENIANLNTTRQNGEIRPYQRKEVIFEEVLRENGLGGVSVKSIEDDDSKPIQIYQPNHPDADEKGYVHKPNIDMHFEMVDLVSSARSYQANLMAMKLFKSVVQQTLKIG